MLRLSAPTPLPDELRMRLRRLKPEIVQLLASRPADNPAAEPSASSGVQGGVLKRRGCPVRV
jgi:hypothetical protein